MTERVMIGVFPGGARPIEIRAGGWGRPARTLRLTREELAALLPLIETALDLPAGHAAHVEPLPDGGVVAGLDVVAAK